MAKKNGMFGKVITWTLALVISIAVGGLFVSGTALSFPILDFLPLIAHQVIGWVIIILAVIGAVMDFTGKLF